jgi:NTP pyrophosphatase (non-canonical NTP hydrolase)
MTDLRTPPALYPGLGIDLRTLSETCLANSARWFPELHERSTLDQVVHQALGLVGEIGEAIDAATEDEISDHDPVALAEELADVLIYTLNLAGLTGVDVGPCTVPLRKGEPFYLMVSGSAALANLVKKANRKPAVGVSLALGDSLYEPIHRVLLGIVDASDLYHLDVPKAVTAKIAVCEARWGTP